LTEKMETESRKKTRKSALRKKMKAAIKEIESKNIHSFRHGGSIPKPVMNRKAFRGILKEFCKVATKNSEAHDVAVLITFLVRFGVEVGKGTYYMVGDSKHYVNLFAATVGETGKARKGTAAKPVKRLFKGLSEFDDWELSREIPGPLSSGEGIIFNVRDEVEEFDKKKQEFIIKDPGIKDKRLFILSEELGGVIIVIKREGNILSVVLRSAWDDGDAAPLTKHDICKTTGAHIGIVAHITIEELIEKLPTSEIFSGFANRFLWPFVERKKLVPNPEKIPDKVLRKFTKKLYWILRFTRTIKEMKFSDTAKKYWAERYTELSIAERGQIGAINNRLEAQAIRVAMIYALLEKSSIIKKCHLISSLAVIEYSRASVKYIFTKHEVDPMAERITNALQAAYPKGLTKTAINSGVFNRNVSSSKLNEVLKGLVLSGLIKKKIKKAKSGKGQPTTSYKLVV